MWGWLVKWERVIVLVFWISVVLISALVNASSTMMEASRSGITRAAWPVYVGEFTSVFVILLLIPVVIWAIAGARKMSRHWSQFLGLLVAGGALFSAIHIGGMMLLRWLIYPLFGAAFTPGPLAELLLYEVRKDAMSYATIVAIVVLWSALIEAHSAALATNGNEAREAPAPARLSFRSGSSTFWVTPEEIHYAQAAGNYVELHLADGSSRLLRQTLSRLESELDKARFVRTHRSYVVRRSAIAALEPTGSGDYVAKLSGDVQVPVSRRYRDGVTVGVPT